MRPGGTVALFTFILVLLSSPLAVEAQPAAKTYRLGWLGPSAGGGLDEARATFLDELRRLGWVEGRHIVMEYRWEPDRVDRLPTLAAELVGTRPDVILTVLTASTRAASQATTKIPIVFTIVSDPVGDGFVASFAHPGRNLTGVSPALIESAGKALQLLREAVPGRSRVAFVWNPDQGRPARRVLEEVARAAPALGVRLQPAEVQRAADIDSAFGAIVGGRAEAVVVMADPAMGPHRGRIADLALKHRLPLMVYAGTRGWSEAGALMSYSPLYPPQFRRAAHLVHKILNGANPADIPVELPTQYEFVVNLKTAKALGLTIPPSVLARADEVIE